jgi:hypothetical protein
MLEPFRPILYPHENFLEEVVWAKELAEMPIKIIRKKLIFFIAVFLFQQNNDKTERNRR